MVWQVLLSLKTQEYPSFFAWCKEGYDHSTGGKNQYLVSRLLGKNVLEHGGTALKDALEAGDKPNGQWGLYSVAGKGVRNAKSRGGNAVNPAWGRAYVEAGECCGLGSDKTGLDILTAFASRHRRVPAI